MVPSAASGVGINEDAIGPVQFVAHVKDGLVLHPVTTRIEIMMSRNDGRGDVPDRKQFGEPLVDGVTRGKRIENGARVGVLLLNPLLDGGRVSVLKPAIVVENFGSVKHVDDRLGLRDGRGVRRVRRFRSLGRGVLQSASGNEQ